MAAQSYQLVMRTGPTPGKTFELREEQALIGRDIAADIVLSDPEISRKHARLIFQAGGYVLEDLGSTNGTFVNGQRLMGPHVLRPGELIMFAENISMAFEAILPDQDATIISEPAMAAAPPAPSREEFPPSPPPPVARPEPAYTPEAPPSPAVSYPEPIGPYPEEGEAEKGRRTWYYAGCGCIIVLLCVAIAGIAVIDSLNLWCAGPLEAFWNSLGYVCR